MHDLRHQLGPLLVTLAYFVVYYGFMVRVLRVKTRLVREYGERGEKFDRYFGNDRFMLAADRSMLNMLEHMPPFLALLWLNALFVSPTSATVGGALYVAARLLHPFVLGPRLGRGLKATVLLATVPGYAVLGYFFVALLRSAATAL